MHVESAGFRRRQALETCDRRTRNCNVLLNAAATRSHGPDHYSIDLDGNSASEDNDSGVIGRVEPEALLTTLCEARQIFGRHVEGSRSPRLIDCDIHASQPSTIHTYVCHQPSARIGNGNVVWNT